MKRGSPGLAFLVMAFLAAVCNSPVEAGILFGRSDEVVPAANVTTDIGVIVLRADADRDAMPDAFEAVGERQIVDGGRVRLLNVDDGENLSEGPLQDFWGLVDRRFDGQDPSVRIRMLTGEQAGRYFTVVSNRDSLGRFVPADVERGKVFAEAESDNEVRRPFLLVEPEGAGADASRIAPGDRFVICGIRYRFRVRLWGVNREAFKYLRVALAAADGGSALSREQRKGAVARIKRDHTLIMSEAFGESVLETDSVSPSSGIWRDGE